MLVLLLLFSLLQYGGTFDPGCSFMNGQCVYSIKLGHEGQCDAQTPAATIASTASTSCYRAVEDDVALMKASMALMTKQIAQLQNKTDVNLASHNGIPGTAQLQQALLEKESELDNVTKQAVGEITRLRQELDACRKRPDCPGRPRTTTTTTATPATTATMATSTTTTTPDGQCPAGVACVRPLIQLLSPLLVQHVWANIEDLHVNVKVGGGLGNPVWTRSKGNSIKWQMGQVDLDSEYTSRPFHIVFEATSRSYMTKPTSTYKYDPVYHDTEGDIAIDDVLAYNTTCKNLPECPPGAFLRTGNDSRSCYTFHTSATFWFRGHLKCKEENARSHLVAINSKEEQGFLVNIIKSDAALTAAGTAGFFTSGNDETMEKHFQWTGAEISNNATYTNWYPGQPNNVGAMQHCLLMEYPNADYQWGDVECDTAHPYICEVDLPKVVHQPGPSL
ncbi:uncharacterized protein [Haliotis cracherodii]|uniref:uncharacterized protein n=1 Tax=Haliotis cracherodii TaxID=6455 RepID=UPI0039EC8477